ncbi:ribonuclease P protein subunit p25-like protein [Mya arenaria]|uniref:ribonuclease P protein subunit p25-like protein n=1 Tax=Mya arenaria TaxID=6604 RepID=UPI0022E534D0|nr:ribonuclease P protein subunit p25-like protein [Mya arenaria]XP_052811719.1 ribonuclease P protein subunit p25-like protein [Mya arenaria]XP_052811726.1 ribonuclease P protein subunit p25-like protein [Mya arenaria]
MENYEKGEVKEVEDSPVFHLGESDVFMRVSGGSKIRNVMGYAMKKIKEPEVKQVCWTGSGKAITKTVSCVEIMKRKVKGLHQVTKLRYRRVEEYWEPKLEGLERLKVNRDIPAISILLSKEPLDKNEPGYQAPGSFDEFWKEVVDKDKSRGSSTRKKLLSEGKSDHRQTDSGDRSKKSWKKRKGDKKKSAGDQGREYNGDNKNARDKGHRQKTGGKHGGGRGGSNSAGGTGNKDQRRTDSASGGAESHDMEVDNTL